MKKALKYLVVVLLFVLTYVGYSYYPKLDIVTGFAAKSVCSCTFEDQRKLSVIEAEDNNIDPVYLAKNVINFEDKSVTSTFFGLKKRKAIYKVGIGCILLPEDIRVNSQEIFQPKRTIIKNDLPFPYGNSAPQKVTFKNIDNDKLQQAVNNAFDLNNEKVKKTRAVLVVYKDQIVAEKYAAGFDKNSKLLGWSMTKSITSAVIGVLEKQAKINVNQNNLFKEWQNDERSKITLNNLLQMNSGLEWIEDYNTISDVTKMLYIDDDMTKTQLDKSFVGKPNNNWNYSSGSTNLLSKFIRNQFKTHQEYLDFWYTELIDKIGMSSMIIETDLRGNYVGSSYAWATVRDWAKFGLLYLHKGNWNGAQILNESWIDYTVNPTNGSEGVYGAQFWLN
ncbi:MAG TPA: serine hydrolase, partial [Flavobacteriaceae bacterium]|nr:serine hydrolase [Flavobacteriaceae bacterium]